MKHFIRFTILLPVIMICLGLIYREMIETRHKRSVPPEYRIAVVEAIQANEVPVRKFKGLCGDYCILYDGKRYEITGICGEYYDNVTYEPETNTFLLTQ